MSLRSSASPLLRNAIRSGPRASLVSARMAQASTAPASSTAAAFARSSPLAKASFSTSVSSQNDFESPFGVNSLSKVTEEEEMLREAVRRFAQEVVQPKVEAMDEAEKMDPEIIKGLFEQGLMGIETSEELGGAGCSFTAAIIVIEGECADDVLLAVCAPVSP